MQSARLCKDGCGGNQCLPPWPPLLPKVRWPDGKPRCPTWWLPARQHHTRQLMTKNKHGRILQGLEPTCKQQFSATSPTVFHDSHLPLTQVVHRPGPDGGRQEGMSAKQLHR